MVILCFFFFFQAEDGIRDVAVTGVQTCALPIYRRTLLFDAICHCSRARMAPHASQAKRERRNHGLDGDAENLHAGSAKGGRAILRPIQIASAGSEVACGCFSPYPGPMFDQAALNASLNGLSAV